MTNLRANLRTAGIAILLAASALGHAAEGLVAVKSPHTAAVTMTRFEDAARQRGLTIFARIDHAAGAAKIGKTLRPAEVLKC